MEIYLLRHGKTDVSGTYTGISDPELSETGCEGVLDIMPLTAGIQLDHCYSSPLKRCRKTVELLDLECECSYDPDLCEIDFGRWEGLTYTEISDTDYKQLHTWFRLKDQFTFPEGDSITAFNQRIMTWFDNLLSSTHERVFIVAHAGVIRLGLCRILSLDTHHAFSFEVQEAALSFAAYENGKARLIYLNKRSV